MGHVPRRRFSQNFLIDTAIIDAIVNAVAPTPSDTVVEIGPGLGAITRPLLKMAGHLHVIDIDRDIIARLRQSDIAENLAIHEGDVLDFDFSSIGPALRIVGNLPYHISTPILFHLALQRQIINDVHVMLQKEVVDRMVARPGTPDYGRLSITLQYRFAMEKLFEIPPEAFRPAPKVTSAIARLVPLDAAAPRAQNESLFDDIVTRVFTQRRKTLKNVLSGFLASADFEALSLDPQVRGEMLGVEAYIRIADHIHRKRAGISA